MKSFLFAFFFLIHVKSNAGWSVDLSRRQVDFDRITDQRMPAVANTSPTQSQESITPGEGARTSTASRAPSSEVINALKNIVNPVTPSLDIVIVQNENGFVPNVIQLKKGEVYQIFIVNLNSKEKNVSFLLESFDQTHSTMFGVMKSFKISPNLEGDFTFQSPETGSQGKLVILGDGRKPAAE